jgi:hypothetical protein
MYLLLLLSVIGALFVFSKVHISSLNVDRWSVIYSFWEAYFNGDYPYFAKSHMNNPPGPMPIYFVIALPFYLINEIGWMPLIAVVIGLILIKELIKNTTSQLIFILFMFSFMGFYWELLSRSTILLNSILVMIVLLYSEKSIYRHNYSFYLSALLTGIILSKADVDEKGGTALSVSHITKKPIFFLGTGQSYDDLEIFDKKKNIRCCYFCQQTAKTIDLGRDKFCARFLARPFDG